MILVNAVLSKIQNPLLNGKQMNPTIGGVSFFTLWGVFSAEKLVFITLFVI